MKGRITLLLLFCVGGFFCLGGCDEGVVASSSSVLPAGEESDAFLDRLSNQPYVNENDAFRGMIYLVDGKDETKDFGQRVELLRAKGIVSDDWNCDADRKITRGRLAYMIYQAAGFKGGVVLSMTGANQRYCLRELQYKNVIGPGAFYGNVTGMEYIAILSRANVFKNSGWVPDASGSLPNEE